VVLRRRSSRTRDAGHAGRHPLTVDDVGDLHNRTFVKR
jgi:hypothetical protein